MIEIFDERSALLMAELLIKSNITFTMETIRKDGRNGYRFNWQKN